MTKSTFLLFFASLISFNNFAQAPKFKFGTVSISELEKTQYEIDSTAEAVILYDKAEVNFGFDENIGFYIDRETTTRIRILKASALSKGIINLSFYRESSNAEEIISDFEGNSYSLENGGLNKSSLNKKSIFEERISEKYFNKKISLPNVKVGGIIEYKYKRRTPLNVMDKPRTWTFQNEEPTLWSEYDITIPTHFYYKIIMGGYLPLEINKKEEVSVSFGHSRLDTYGIKYLFAVKNAPAFKNEPYITTAKDYVSKIEFDLAKVTLPGQPAKEYSLTWESLDKTLNESDNFGRRLKKASYLKDIIQKFEGVTVQKEKLEKLYTYFTTNFEADLDKDYLWAPTDLKKILDNKKGTATELNLMFIALLRELEYDANPVILSTRNNGMISKTYAQIDQFNYAIANVKLNGMSYNLDVSSPNLKFGMLPIRCLNGVGRLIKSNSTGEFISLTPEEKLKDFTNIELSFDPKNANLLGKYTNSGAGYYSYLTRLDYFQLGEAKFIEKIKSEASDWELKNIELINFKENEKVLSYTYNFEKKSEDEEMPDMIYLDPIIIGKIAKNPFNNNKRNYPVDFGYAQEETYKMILQLPANYTAITIPKNSTIKLENDAGIYTYNAGLETTTNKITIVSKLSLKNPIYSAQQFLELKEFYNRIIQKQNEQIVFKKN
jgi:hypothetical protein